MHLSADDVFRHTCAEQEALSGTYAEVGERICSSAEMSDDELKRKRVTRSTTAKKAQLEYGALIEEGRKMGYTH